MSELTVQRSADTIATEIVSIRAAAEQAMVIVATNASFEIGRRLCEAKEIVPSGEWMAYIEERLNYGKSTAENLMRIYRDYGSQDVIPNLGKSPAELFGQLSQSQMVAMFGLPLEQRVELMEEKPEVAEMSAREIQKLVKEKKAAEKAKAAAEKERDRERKEREKADKIATDQADRAEKAEKQLNDLRQSSKDIDRELEREREERGRLEEKVKALEGRPIEINAEPSEEQIARIRAEAQAEMRQRVEDANRRADAAERKAAWGNATAEERLKVELETVKDALERLLTDIRKYSESEPARAELAMKNLRRWLETKVGKEE